MNTEKYSRQISLRCHACGGTRFEYDETIDSDEQIVKCAQCDRETTKRELMNENSENINAHVREVADEAVKDITKELNKTLKRIFW
ncbi:MAG: hypothetical protein ACK5W9_05975 [Bdellovibrionales bacterium]